MLMDEIFPLLTLEQTERVMDRLNALSKNTDQRDEIKAYIDDPERYTPMDEGGDVPVG